MDLANKDKLLISIIEAILLILLVLFSVLTIFEILSTEFYSPLEIFNLWPLRFSVMLFILFIFLPYILNISKNLSEKALMKYNQQKFTKDFQNDIKGEQEINILHLSNKYNVNLIYIKNFLRDQITQGYLKGELIGDIFKIKAEMKKVDKKEQSVENFNENIKIFIAPHSLIKIKEISKHFRLPKGFVKQKLIHLIDKREITGFIQGSTLIRSVFSTNEIECPYCGKEIRLNEDL